LNYYDINSFRSENPYNPGTRPLRGCRSHFAVPRIDDSLASIGPAANALRAWFFQPFTIAVPLSGGAPARDWSIFDRTLAAVKRAGMRIVVTLTEGHGTCDLPAGGRTIDWYRTGYRTDLAPRPIASYRSYAREIVTRYRNHTEILAWQLVNEPSALNDDESCDEPSAAKALRAFADDVGGLIKSLDANHLVSLGTGLGGCGFSGPGRSDYKLVHASPGIDLCEHHDYFEPTVPLPSVLQRELEICGRLNKPLFVGEIGIEASEVTSVCRAANRFPTCRSRLLRAKFDAQLSASSESAGPDVVGILVWDWCETIWTHCIPAQWDIVSGDPVLKVLASLPTA
jgi:hypothetical protein